jgi:hypothetical protein
VRDEELEVEPQGDTASPIAGLWSPPTKRTCI